MGGFNVGRCGTVACSAMWRRRNRSPENYIIAGLRALGALAVVDVVRLVERFFRWSQRQNHGGRSGRIQLLLKSGDTGLRVEVGCKRPGIAEQGLVFGVRLAYKCVPVQPDGLILE